MKPVLATFVLIAAHFAFVSGAAAESIGFRRAIIGMSRADFMKLDREGIVCGSTRAQLEHTCEREDDEPNDLFNWSIEYDFTQKVDPNSSRLFRIRLSAFYHHPDRLLGYNDALESLTREFRRAPDIQRHEDDPAGVHESVWKNGKQRVVVSTNCAHAQLCIQYLLSQSEYLSPPNQARGSFGSDFSRDR